MSPGSYDIPMDLSVKTRRKLRLEEFLRQNLDHAPAGRVIQWVKRDEGIFRILWTHQSSGAFTHDDAALFRYWALARGKPANLSSVELKQSLRMALNKSPSVERVPAAQDEYRYFKFTEWGSRGSAHCTSRRQNHPTSQFSSSSTSRNSPLSFLPYEKMETSLPLIATLPMERYPSGRSPVDPHFSSCSPSEFYYQDGFTSDRYLSDSSASDRYSSDGSPSDNYLSDSSISDRYSSDGSPPGHYPSYSYSSETCDPSNIMHLAYKTDRISANYHKLAFLASRQATQHGGQCFVSSSQSYRTPSSTESESMNSAASLVMHRINEDVTNNPNMHSENFPSVIHGCHNGLVLSASSAFSKPVKSWFHYHSG